MFDLQISYGNPLPKVIEYQFMKRFGIQVLPLYHFSFIPGLLDFDQHSGKAFGICPGMDDQVVPAFCVQVETGSIPGILQKIAQIVLIMLLGLFLVKSVQQSQQVFLEKLDLPTRRFYLQKGFVQGFAGRKNVQVHYLSAD